MLLIQYLELTPNTARQRNQGSPDQTKPLSFMSYFKLVFQTDNTDILELHANKSCLNPSNDYDLSQRLSPFLNSQQRPLSATQWFLPSHWWMWSCSVESAKIYITICYQHFDLRFIPTPGHFHQNSFLTPVPSCEKRKLLQREKSIQILR